MNTRSEKLVAAPAAAVWLGDQHRWPSNHHLLQVSERWLFAFSPMLPLFLINKKRCAGVSSEMSHFPRQKATAMLWSWHLYGTSTWHSSYIGHAFFRYCDAYAGCKNLDGSIQMSAWLLWTNCWDTGQRARRRCRTPIVLLLLTLAITFDPILDMPMAEATLWCCSTTRL